METKEQKRSYRPSPFTWLLIALGVLLLLGLTVLIYGLCQPSVPMEFIL